MATTRDGEGGRGGASRSWAPSGPSATRALLTHMRPQVASAWNPPANTDEAYYVKIFMMSLELITPKYL